MKSKYAILLLLLTSFIWGLSFVAQSTAADSIGPFTFNALRFFIGTIVLIPFIIKPLKSEFSDKEYLKKLFKSGLICGTFLSFASFVQQAGINAGTDSGKAGFITSLYILFVPIISLFFRKKVSLKIWICVAIGLVGAYLLSIDPNSTNESRLGDGLVLLSALIFALHITAIDKFAKGVNGIELSALQYLVAGIICLFGMIIFEPVQVSSIKEATFCILYAGIFSCGIAYTLQIIGQRYVDATPATLALSLESVFAAFGGAVILGERMNGREIAGALLLFSAVIISEINVKKKA